MLAIGAGFLVALGIGVKVLPKLLGWYAMPLIPWDNPSNAQIQSYITAAAIHPMVEGYKFL